MSTTERTYDFVIFGATGFTGERVAKYLAHIIHDQSLKYKWAVAGRDVTKLASVIRRLGESYPDCLKETKIIKADVRDQKSLSEMAATSRVVLDCVGPYRFYGEPVVKACIENGSHYLDICGEPEYMDRMILEYHRAAEKAGVLIVTSCGFDSIPADLGVLYTIKQFEATQRSSRDTNAVLTKIEGFITINAAAGFVGNYATWESAVHGFSNIKSLTMIRSKLSKDKELSPTIPRVPGITPQSKKPYYEKLLRRYAVLFPGSDNSVVRHTQRALAVLGEKSPFPWFTAYFTVSSYFTVILMGIVSFVLKILTKFKFGRWLLLTFPYIFSFGSFRHGGPTQKALEGTTIKYDFIAEGQEESKSDKKTTPHLHTRFSGPEPGYVLTPICIVQAALCLLEERGKIRPNGGVFTPGAVFAPTSLEERLSQNGCKFEIIKS